LPGVAEDQRQEARVEETGAAGLSLLELVKGRALIMGRHFELTILEVGKITA